MLWLHGTFDYTPSPASRICYGRGRLRELPELLGSVGGKRALVVTSPSVCKAGLVDRAAEALGERLAGVFEGTRPHSPIEVVHQAVALSRQVEADSVISLGGGSCVDTAKGVVWFRREENGQRLPHIAVPTTLSGAEFTTAAGITHGPTKRLYRAPFMVATVVLLDPEAAAVTPAGLLLPSGLNAMHHCVEGVSSVGGNAVADGMFLRALRLLREALPRIREDERDLEARAQALAGAALAALGIWKVPMGLGHALAHVIGGKYKTPHANTHAVLIAPVMAFNHDAVIPAQAAIAEVLGVHGTDDPVRTALEGIERFRRLLAQLGVPRSLSELGVPSDELEADARAAMDDPCFSTNPKPARLEQVVEVLRAAL